MKNLNQYIQEKYLIDIDTVDDEKFNEISFIIAEWLFEKDTYKGHKNNRFEFLKYHNNNINDLIDKFQAFGKLSRKCGFGDDYADFENFVEKNNDRLLKFSEKYYHDIYDEIAF